MRLLCFVGSDKYDDRDQVSENSCSIPHYIRTAQQSELIHNDNNVFDTNKNEDDEESSDDTYLSRQHSSMTTDMDFELSSDIMGAILSNSKGSLV